MVTMKMFFDIITIKTIPSNDFFIWRIRYIHAYL